MTATFIRKLFNPYNYRLYELDQPWRGYRHVAVGRPHGIGVVYPYDLANRRLVDDLANQGPCNDYAAVLNSLGYERVVEDGDRCNRCEILLGDDRESVHEDEFCPECLDSATFVCDDCGERELCGNGSDVPGGMVCETCREDNYFYCDNCGSTFHNDDYGEDGCCESCFGSHSHLILDYSDRSAGRLGPFGNPKDKIYFGVELEVCTKRGLNESAQRVTDRMDGFAVLKEDCSLGGFEGGFEIVTGRATLEEHTKRWAWLKDNPVPGLVSFNTSCCGMHVHVSRDPLSALTVGKMLVFLNHKDNERLVTAIAGRSANSYCRRYEKTITDGHYSRRYDADRYEALNVSGDKTIEFRLFKGTLKYESFLKNLQFVRALLDWAPHASLKVPQDDFLNFVEKHRSSYRQLRSFLVAKNFIREVVCA